jgi:hypothetical protein
MGREGQSVEAEDRSSKEISSEPFLSVYVEKEGGLH